MSFLVGLLTFVLVLDSLFLVVLILAQLPKKEAGAGTAFGGGATDVLFGAGTGNVLTKVTKWATGIFLGLCVFLYVVGGKPAKDRSSVRDELTKSGTAPVLPVSTKLPPPSLNPAPGSPAVTPALSNAPPASRLSVPNPGNVTITPTPATPPSTTPPVKK